MDYFPLLLSLKISFTATFFSFILGIITARIVMNLKKFKFIVDTFLSLPLVLPPTVIGFFLLIIFGKNSIIGKILEYLQMTIIFSWKGEVISAIIVSFPLIYKTVKGAFEQIDKNLIYAARTIGMNELKILFFIMIPISWSSIIAGTILAFARAMGEFGATIMIAGNIPGKTQTMSMAVYTAVQSGNKMLAFKWSVVILSISFIMILFINNWEKNRN